MGKSLKLPVHSLGSEVEDPSLKQLATWIRDHHGREGDLLTYKLEESLRHQKEVDLPAVGGRMYGVRIETALSKDKGEHPFEGFVLSPDQLVADAAQSIALRKGLWFSIPAPHLLSLKGCGSNNDKEYTSEVIAAYGQLLRYMRDAGIKGHVLLCDEIIEEELERLTGKRQLMYSEALDQESLSLLLEYQARIAVPASFLDLVRSVRDEFEISQLILVDPSPEHLHSVLQDYDPDSIIVGGYCNKTCEKYWSQLVARAQITLSSPQP